MYEEIAKRLLDPRDDSDWLQFVGLFNRKRETQYDLVRYLFDSRLRPSIRKRVMFSLLVPTKDWLYKLWGMEVGTRLYERARYPYRGDFLKVSADVPTGIISNKTLPVVDATNAAELLREFSALAKKDERGFGGRHSVYQDPASALRIYGHYQLQLLTRRRSPMLTNSVFEDFLDNLQAAHCESSRCLRVGIDGYLLFGTALSFEDLPLKWKKAIDLRMRELVLAENETGELSHPEFSAAWSYATQILQPQRRSPRCERLFKGQLEFLLNNLPEDFQHEIFRRGGVWVMRDYLEPADTQPHIRAEYVRRVIKRRMRESDTAFVGNDTELKETEILQQLLGEESTDPHSWEALDYAVKVGKRYIERIDKVQARHRNRQTKEEAAVISRLG